MPSWLILAWSLTLGYMPTNYSEISGPGYSGSQLLNSRCIDTNLALEARAFGHFRVATEVQTFAFPASPNFNPLLGFYPFESQYRIAFELYSKHLVLGIRHECDHPTLSSRWDSPQLLGTKTEAYLTLQGETSF
jgi:hypothetical protein